MTRSAVDVRGRKQQPPQSLAKASGSMAIATLVSRITGFLWKIQLAWVAGLTLVNDSFTVANTLPNIIYELLLGGVLASVVVPLLVRAQDDPDGGQEYTNRLLTVGMTVLLGGTVVAVAMAPLFTSLYMDGSTGSANPELTTAFAYLLLPEIVFYGLFALLSAILQAKHVFGPTAWAPVVNNVVIMVTIGIYAIVPGEISLDPVRMGDVKLLVLGLGVTLGIVVQALVLLPALRRTGFRFRWTWGLEGRLKEFGGLARADRRRAGWRRHLRQRVAAVPAPLRRDRCLTSDRDHAEAVQVRGRRRHREADRRPLARQPPVHGHARAAVRGAHDRGLGNGCRAVQPRQRGRDRGRPAG
jgi:hypothetical protein